MNVTFFSIFLTVSSVANCGLLPNKENLAVFSKNTGLLLLLIPQFLAGNTLFPIFLRISIWGLRKITINSVLIAKNRRKLAEEKEEIFGLMLEKPEELEFPHLMPRFQTVCLGLTVAGFVVIQVALYCAMDWWSSSVLGGFDSYQKAVNVLFMSVSARHAGEGSLDLAATSSSVLVLFILMMFLPGSTFYLFPRPEKRVRNQQPKTTNNTNKGVNSFARRHVLPHAAWLLIFVVIFLFTWFEDK